MAVTSMVRSHVMWHKFIDALEKYAASILMVQDGNGGNIPLQYQYIHTRLHGVAFQGTVFFNYKDSWC